MAVESVISQSSSIPAPVTRDDHEARMEHEWTHCYRMRPHFRNVGLVCIVFFAVIGVFSTLAAYFNIDGSFARPELGALVFGLFWSAFTCLGLWLL